MMPPTTFRPAAGVCAAVADQRALAGTAAAAPDVLATRGSPAWKAAEQLAARALLRRLLAAEYGDRTAELPIAARPSGQPYLRQRPDLAISLSHDGGYVAVAVGREVAVGIDVQQPVPVADAVIRRCCGAAGQRELARLARRQSLAEFARIWTVQEACVKLTGAGLAGRPWSVPVAVGQWTGRWRGGGWQSLPGAGPFPVSIAYRQEQS
ncbi:MAG TPA: 4'-phosphopantetheinyl transferase superfamily protein [Jatrophihabitans sp.]|nr:4'-phosphopantetheinyl transferase superfamily protein [Jatrophihabitans sp.]